jgi:hypothetical protein
MTNEVKRLSPLAQAFIWIGLFCAASFMYRTADDDTVFILALVALQTTLGGIVGTFFKRPLLFALLAYGIANIWWILFSLGWEK